MTHFTVTYACPAPIRTRAGRSPAFLITLIMRPTLLLFVALSVGSAHANWFGSETPAYETWDKPELEQWLKEHNINAPSTYSTSQLQGLVKSNWDAFATAVPAWSYDQYTKAQKSFENLKDASFETWDESRLREFLLEQGIVAPSGPREQLILLAKQKHAGYHAAAASFANEASKTAGGYASSASSVAATATSAIAQATRDVQRSLNDGTDYVYSSWDDSALRKYLEDKGIVDKKTATGLSREQLLEQMRTGYASVSEPVWDAWSDSYIVSSLLSLYRYPMLTIPLSSANGFSRTTSYPPPTTPSAPPSSRR